jgi:hypothetical protein
MRRRGFLLGAASAAAIALFPSRAWALTISGLWVQGPFAQSTAYAVKGKLYFRLSGDRSDRVLNTYWNGSTTKDSTRQCPELIKRYARLIGFAGYTGGTLTGDNGNKLPSLGDGDAVASRFASASGSGFKYYSNGSSTLPKTGSVISISGYSQDGVLRIDGGHVGILCNYTPPTSTTTSFSVLLFDQNFPVAVWKEIRFEKRSGKWYATWTNNLRLHNIIGWATPS